MPKKSKYSAKDITVLKGLEPVRKRPGMYIGGTGKEGLHHLIWEVLDNSIDEAMAGYCNDIVITLKKDNVVSLSDNGRGIPVEKHPTTKKSALETVLTVLHAGGKFGSGGYKVSGGLHGVGVSVVNALSVHLKAEIKRDGKVHVMEFKRGKTTSKMKTSGKASNTGTTITFTPDEKIFKSIDFSWKKILSHLRQQAYLNRKLKITLIDEREAKTAEMARVYSFYFEGGILSYLKHLNADQKVINSTPFYVHKEVDDVICEIAMQYTDEINSYEAAFVNNINTREGGTHSQGFKTAITRVINDYARKHNFLKEKEANLTGDDIREGLTTVISIKMREPQFEGQTKSKLGNAEIRPVVSNIVSDALNMYLDENPNDAKAIIAKCMLAAKARLAAKAAKDTVIRKGVMDGLTLPGKLADCSSKEAEKCELYIVEGDSAGGSAKQGRDRAFQAILPLRGKILNVEKARLDRMLSSKEIKSLIIAMGIGVGDQKNFDKLRYHRIVIMTDADVDGAHIRTLLLTFFYRYFDDVIKKGHLYIAQPPLYSLKKGTKLEYAYTEEDKNEIIEELKNQKTKGRKKAKSKKTKEDDKQPSDVQIQRYKGLGEMNPEQLWETTMNPENRVMLKVNIEDAEQADEMFDVLMGDEVEPRRRFIQTHAKSVKNLDI